MLEIPWNGVKMLLEIPWEGSKKMGFLDGGAGINWNSPLYESTPTVIMPPPGGPQGFDFSGEKIVKFPTVWSKTKIKIPSVQAKGIVKCLCLPFRFLTFNTKIEIYLKRNKGSCKNINNTFGLSWVACSTWCR